MGIDGLDLLIDDSRKGGKMDSEQTPTEAPDTQPPAEGDQYEGGGDAGQDEETAEEKAAREQREQQEQSGE
jgi:hypothetical protein